MQIVTKRQQTKWTFNKKGYKRQKKDKRTLSINKSFSKARRLSFMYLTAYCKNI